MSFEVFDKRDGRRICQCSHIGDALDMIRFDPQVRGVRRLVSIEPETVDVSSVELPPDLQLKPQLILEESDLQPVII